MTPSEQTPENRPNLEKLADEKAQARAELNQIDPQAARAIVNQVLNAESWRVDIGTPWDNDIPSTGVSSDE